jgi:hypothetical protein
MTSWVRFNWKDNTHLGTLDGDEITVCSNDLFDAPSPSGEKTTLSEVELPRARRFQSPRFIS